MSPKVAMVTSFCRRLNSMTRFTSAADRAFQTGRDSPEAHWAMGWYYFYGHLDYDRAMEHFRIAQQKLRHNTTGS